MGGAQKSPDAALILRLPQEVLDTICAFIRDDDRSDDEGQLLLAQTCAHRGGEK